MKPVCWKFVLPIPGCTTGLAELTPLLFDNIPQQKKETEVQTGLANPRKYSIAVLTMKPIAVGLVPMTFQLEILLAHKFKLAHKI